jgi:hypothetical protein
MKFLTTLKKAKSFESIRIVPKNPPQNLNEERGESLSFNGGRERKCRTMNALESGLSWYIYPLYTKTTKMPLKSSRGRARFRNPKEGFRNPFIPWPVCLLGFETHAWGFRNPLLHWVVLTAFFLCLAFESPEPSFHALLSSFETRGGIPNVPHAHECFRIPLGIIGSLGNALFAPITYRSTKATLARKINQNQIINACKHHNMG